eukprot:gb/GEZN01016660.1/.p1 GENE.gb/GEZN01016660.1/~~gb/GEZN01016660.1/.p1  ORF type:complete len:117 (+),score=7.55 gb/GEZN01016660.1/:53-403(+)
MLKLFALFFGLLNGNREKTCPLDQPQPITACDMSMPKTCSYENFCCPKCPNAEEAVCHDLTQARCENEKWVITSAMIVCNCEAEELKPLAFSSAPRKTEDGRLIGGFVGETKPAHP